MSDTSRNILRRPLVIYPLLFAIFPILFFYAHNIKEMSPEQIVMPLVASVLFTILLWAILILILRNILKASLATTIFLFFFFSFGHFYELLEKWDVFVPSHGHLLPAVLLVFGYCIYFIKLARRDFMTTAKILTIMAMVLIVVNVFNIGFYHARTALSAPEYPEDTGQEAITSIDPEKLKTMPDIYLIILDEYAHPDTMREYYDYDNTAFINSLEDKGFYIFNRSKTRTPHTPLVIAQVLNMEYLTPGWYWDAEKIKYVEIVAAEGDYPSDSPWSEPTYQRLAYNKVAEFLRAQGYQYIAFGNWVTCNRWDSHMQDNTDLYFNYYESTGTTLISEFQETLWNTTMLRPFYQHLAGSQYETAWRRQTLHTLEHLKTMPEAAGPKFVFAHIFCPHASYVFSAKGEYVDPINWNNYRDKQFYREQYIFVSAEIEKLINVLLAKSKTPPIIIIQSDHGPRPHHPGIVIGGDEWAKILNAMYLPGADKAVLHEFMSPVNTFRLIFNLYFGTDFQLLEDD